MVGLSWLGAEEANKHVEEVDAGLMLTIADLNDGDLNVTCKADYWGKEAHTTTILLTTIQETSENSMGEGMIFGLLIIVALICIIGLAIRHKRKVR